MKKGFTLIELLVVVAIVGLVASVVLASLSSARKRSRDARRIDDIKQIRTALELYFSVNSSYPTALSALVPEQIPVIPADPLGNTGALCRTAAGYCYAYSPLANPTYYHIGAQLEETTNPAFNSDKDCSSAGTGCPAGVAYINGFDGTDPIYDIIP
ncbi:MAG: hypothetical protein A3H02_01225 [Candidatus Niyogibacteria bacterium RIFCSPLOWO2_12_FULL_41_13]|uniref:Type II secretion system protein GspG C-terminal domain-containing protein n=1 Tax=Candidatus Niyogibacteria bacterium RIFCSPLOWO2_12_FULL_41_13 TaxID=1801726 RepID=A0A1G2F4W4_9BACT|nr:MAG: hypothetical protein A3H02_01225 [Candidatus Niyogibacteria bacterium RIFCSPLOWO2_12_FULL_41_13]